MGKEEKLLNKIGRDNGMRVPEGYFEELNRHVMSQLPEYPQAPKAKPLSIRQRIKPYIYMAAMFAGIWCMMKMFHISMQNAGVYDAPSAEVVAAIQNPDVYEYYMDTDGDDVNDYEIESSVIESYDDMADFEKDFGYELKPEYASITIENEKQNKNS